MNWYELFESLLEQLGARLGISKARLEKVFKFIFWVYLAVCAVYGFAFYAAATASFSSKILTAAMWVVGGAICYWMLMLAAALSFRVSRLALRILLSGTGLAVVWYLIKKNFFQE